MHAKIDDAEGGVRILGMDSAEQPLRCAVGRIEPDDGIGLEARLGGSAPPIAGELGAL